MKKDDQKDINAAAVEATMSDAVAVTLGELAGLLRVGLLALAVGAGFQVVDALMFSAIANTSPASKSFVLGFACGRST